MKYFLTTILILMATICFAQERIERQKASQNMDSAIEAMNKNGDWLEYLETGETKIPKAVRRKIGKEFSRGKGFRIIKGEKVQTRTSPRQQRAIRLQGDRR